MTNLSKPSKYNVFKFIQIKQVCPISNHKDYSQKPYFTYDLLDLQTITTVWGLVIMLKFITF
jgi:hypothetical protein